MDLSTLTLEQWVDIGISILVFAGIAILGRQLIRFIFQGVIRRLIGFTGTTLDDVALDAIDPPLYWLALLLAFRYSLDRLGFISDRFRSDVGQLYFVLFLLLGFLVAWRLITSVALWYESRLTTGGKIELSRQLMPFLRRVALIILTVSFAIILLDRFNVEISGLVATLGIGSLAIALAAQAALADTISGFVIMIDRPYRVGDRIEIQDLETWGDVMDIGLRSTRIRTRDNRMVIVPNSVIGKSLIVNYSYPDMKYRIENHVGVAYGTDIERVREILIQTVSKVDGVLVDHPVEALFLEFGDSALIFRIRWWLDSFVDTRRMFDRVNSAIYKALNDANIEIPFPQRVVTYKDLPFDKSPAPVPTKG